MSGHRIAVTRTDGIGRIVLNNAENRNAVDLEFCEQFANAATQCASDKSLKVIVVEARGDFFSVGGDLADFLGHADDLEHYILQCVARFHIGIRYLAQCQAPVVVGLAGMAAGGGFSIVCGGDIVIATESARLNSGYTRSGLTPDGGGTYLLPRLVGWQKAFEIMALNRTIGAHEAQRLGLVSSVVPDDRFSSELENLVTALANSVPGVLAELKTLMRTGQDSSFSQQLDAEAISIANRAAQPETLARLRSFLRS